MRRLLFLALVCQLALAPMRGHVHDVTQLKAWVQTATAAPGPLYVYSTSTSNYPPLALLPLIALGGLYRLVSPEFSDSVILTALLKLPAIAANLATAALLYHLVRRRNSEQSAVRCLAAYALNPAVWYATAWWGQLESLYVLPMVLSVSALATGRAGQSGAWLATGILVKPQAIVLAPVIILGGWTRGGWRWLRAAGLAAGGVLTLVLAPLAWAGQLPALMAQLQASAGRQLFLTMNAHNLWYLLTSGRGSFAARLGEPIYDFQPLIGVLTGWQLGLILLLVWCGLVCWYLWQQGRSLCDASLYLAAAALSLGFFSLAAESHERYLFPVLAMLVPLLPDHLPARLLYGLFSLTLLLNLWWVDPAIPMVNTSQSLGWGMPIALLNTAALGFTAYLLVTCRNRTSTLG